MKLNNEIKFYNPFKANQKGMKMYKVAFKDGTELKGKFYDRIEAEHYLSLYNKRKGNISKVDSVKVTF